MYRWRARHGSRERQSGYMLLMLMLAVAMLAITMLSVATNYRQSIRRDREVEMIHRGVQYERAVRLYYRKNNSYPPSIDRLVETNKIRYLRKRYKDPMTPDGAWKIAHLTDVNLPAASTGLGTPGTPETGGGSAGGLGGTSTPTSAGQQSGALGTTSGGSTSGTGPASTSGGTGEVLGGGAMIGVVSKSKQEGVHSFNEKSRYNEWLFIYLPSQDTNQLGAIPNGPFNPKATTTTGVVGQPGSTNSGSTSSGSTSSGSTPQTTAPETTTPTGTTPGATQNP